MLYLKPVPDVDILFTFVTVYSSVFSLIVYQFLPLKTEWWGAGVVVCLEKGADNSMIYI